MLLALSALPEELEVLLLSITYGNIDVDNCLRNVVSMFYHIEKEIAWRQSQGRSPGFDTLRKHKPVIAVGPEKPLADQILMADYFRMPAMSVSFLLQPLLTNNTDGKDGLGGIHHSVSFLSAYTVENNC